MKFSSKILNHYARQENDSDKTSFMKRLIFMISMSVAICGLIWSFIYYSVFGLGLTMSLPAAFTVIVSIMILISHKIKNHRPLIFTLLICITFISALIQWSIGSLNNSGMVIIWCFLAPLGAIIFLSMRQAFIWMVIFILIVLISAFFEPKILVNELFVSENTIQLFYVMNIGALSIVVFLSSAWFIKTIKFERNRFEKLLNKVQALFGQYVSQEVVTDLISKDKIESNYHDVTVMFLDIRDFTLFADSRTPKEVVIFQNKIFGELINIVRANKGIVNQALGDGILAVFGTPIVTETHAMDAVEAAQQMLDKVEELGKTGEIPEIKVGIGLHSGNIIAGEVGNEHRKFYSLAGSNVIIASRVEQLNKELDSQFLITESVKEKLNLTNFTGTYMGDKKLKGISKLVGIYKLA